MAKKTAPENPGKCRVEISLKADITAKLHAKAAALGLEDAAYVRMLVYRDVNGVEDARADSIPLARGPYTGVLDHNPGRGSDDGFPTSVAEQPEPIPAEEMDIPADPDDGGLDDLLRAGPSLLDGLMAQASPEQQQLAQRPGRQMQPQRTYRPPLSNHNRGLQPVYGPGSMTRAIGVNDMTVGTNNTGDGRGNVLRDNMRHFGIAGSRSR